MGTAGYHRVGLLSRQQTSFEIHPADARELLIFEEFACRLSILTPQGLRKSLQPTEVRPRRTTRRGRGRVDAPQLTIAGKDGALAVRDDAEFVVGLQNVSTKAADGIRVKVIMEEAPQEYWSLCERGALSRTTRTA